MDDLPVDEILTIPGHELRVRTARSSGPGGQHVNKTETKVELRWCPAESEALEEGARERLIQRLGGRLTREGDLVVTSSDERSQLRNIEIARQRLARIVRGARIEKARRIPTRPKRSAVEKRIDAKRKLGSKKRDRRDPSGEG